MKILLAIAMLVIVGYAVWDRNFSRSAKIESAYNTCMKHFSAATDKAKADASNQQPKGDDAAAALAKGMGDAMTSMVQGFGGALCGTIKDSCKQDFDGPICQAALNRSR